MNQEELEKHIRKKLRNGYPAGELENELLARGISKEAITNAMSNPKHQWDKKSIRRNVIAINIACLLFALLASVLAGTDTMLVLIIGSFTASLLYFVLFWQRTKNK